MKQVNVVGANISQEEYHDAVLIFLNLESVSSSDLTKRERKLYRDAEKIIKNYTLEKTK